MSQPTFRATSHILQNEDNRRYSHPGYYFRECQRCKSEYPVGKGEPAAGAELCADPQCQPPEVKA